MGGVSSAGISRLNAVVVLGATGSIGRQTLDVAERLQTEVVAIAARHGSEELLELAARWPDAVVVAVAATSAERERLSDELGERARFGPEELVSVASDRGRTVVNGIVGVAGLPASVAALQAGNMLALANKESLVAGGRVVTEAATAGGGEIIAIDSEHHALGQCLAGEDVDAVRRLILTASGGPFRGRPAEALESVTVEEALAHPVWDMGNRISIDSATLMNKGFEVIEAHHLFGVGYDDISVVVHPEGYVHAMVEFVDGSVRASIAEADMRIPIQAALTHPDRRPAPASFEPAGRSMTFEPPDRSTFPCLELGYEAGRRSGSAPAVLNAADEVAVGAFLEKRIGFSSIPVVIGRTLEKASWSEPASVDDVMAADAEGRGIAREIVAAC